MSNQQLLELSYDNDDKRTLFTSHPETSIPELLLPLLAERGYFGLNSDAWMQRIRSCGNISLSIQAYYDCGHSFAIEAGCNSRVCFKCNVRYKRKIVKKIGFICASMREIRFMTISPKNYTKEEFSSGFAVKDLNVIWQVIRKRLEFDFGFPLGNWIAVREFKFNNERGDWNIHLHVLYDSTFIPQPLLKNIVWKYTKGRSRHADIRKIDPYGTFGPSKSIKYISKYIGKFENVCLDVNSLADFYMNTKSKKLITYSQNFDKGAYKAYSLKCPECYKGMLSQIVVVFTQGKEFCISERNIDSLAIIAKFKQNFEFSKIKKLDYSHALLQKIDAFLLADGSNIDLIHQLLSEKEVNYLLSRGFIFHARNDRYEPFV